MEPEISLPHSQASATCPYPGSALCSPHKHIPPPGDPSCYYTPIYAKVFLVFTSVRFPHQHPIRPLSSPTPEVYSYVQKKRNPITALDMPRGCPEFMLQISRQSSTEGSKDVSLSNLPPLPEEISLVLISGRSLSPQPGGRNTIVQKNMWWWQCGKILRYTCLWTSNFLINP